MQQLIEFLTRHWILSSALLAVLVLMALNELWMMLRSEKKLSPPDAVRLINDNNALVLDVRSVADFKKGHIINALNIPLAKLEERIGEIGKNKEKPVLCYCMLGSSAPQACTRLKKLGFTTVYSLRGGLNAWQGASLPVTIK
jgi:rhodanese-related sulfurtransferase